MGQFEYGALNSDKTLPLFLRSHAEEEGNNLIMAAYFMRCCCCCFLSSHSGVNFGQIGICEWRDVIFSQVHEKKNMVLFARVSSVPLPPCGLPQTMAVCICPVELVGAQCWLIGGLEATAAARHRIDCFLHRHCF
ncbi:hypothetical protein TcCL_NonESM04527 [Trypanosoma cruzi]|nr:hypothetical protein TcCL_NonESM04527 [Trypanosoma cruzi]